MEGVRLNTDCGQCRYVTRILILESKYIEGREPNMRSVANVTINTDWCQCRYNNEDTKTKE